MTVVWVSCEDTELRLGGADGRLPESWHAFCLAFVSGWPEREDSDASSILTHFPIAQGCRVSLVSTAAASAVLTEAHSSRCDPVVASLAFAEVPDSNFVGSLALHCVTLVTQLSIAPSHR